MHYLLHTVYSLLLIWSDKKMKAFAYTGKFLMKKSLILYGVIKK